MAVVEAEQFRAEPDGKHQHADAAQPRDQKMPEFVEEHDDRQHEQKRNDVPDEASSPNEPIPDMKLSNMYALAAWTQMFLPIRLANVLGRLCGELRQAALRPMIAKYGQ